MEITVIVPSVGESIQEAILMQWYKQDGDMIKNDEPLFVLETDKITLEVNAEADGVLKILVPEGETVAIGATVGSVNTEGEAEPAPPEEPETATKPRPVEEIPPTTGVTLNAGDLSPSVRRLVAQHNIDITNLKPTGPAGRITKGDLLLYLEAKAAPEPETTAPLIASPEIIEEKVVREPMTPIRRRIAERLLEAKHNTAMLTTFNEIDMKHTMEIRSLYKESFQKKHGVSLGFMSFFVKASVQALQEFPKINAFIDEQEIVYHNYHHVGIAVGSAKGLVVPVIRHADRLSFAQIERAIVDYVTKIKENKLELADLEGGTFTISNGGVYGSLLSTPILNTPQSGILGMHKIEKRPVVVNDEIVIRPMMYIALSYDHRIVDGGEAVTCLKRIKEYVENPERILMEV